MKSVLLPILFLFLVFNSSSQELDTTLAKQFIQQTLPAFVSLNKEKILVQTHYPIPVGDKKLTKEQFKLVLDKTFSPELRQELAKKGIKDIDAWEMLNDTTPTYMLVCYDGLDPQYEAVVLCFFQYNGKWLLNKIDYHKAGEE